MTTGHDISKTRLDDLDRRIITQSLAEPFEKRVVCNFGCGESRLSQAVASIGHKVYNYDSRDLVRYFNLQQELGLSVYFTQPTLEELKPHQLPRAIDIAVFQRVLHYLSYGDAQRVLEVVLKRVVPGGYVYLSFSSIDSELGVGYEAKGQSITHRWGTLTEDNQKKFNITQPVCLYRVQEVEDMLSALQQVAVESIEVSEFGNIKAVVKKI